MFSAVWLARSPQTPAAAHMPTPNMKTSIRTLTNAKMLFSQMPPRRQLPWIRHAVVVNNGGIIKRNHLHNRDINGQSPPGFIVNKNLFSYTEHVWFGCPYRSSSAALRSRLSPYCRVIKFPPLYSFIYFYVL